MPGGQNEWEEAAKELGLDVQSVTHPRNFEMEGEYNDYPIRFWILVKSTANNSWFVGAVEVPLSGPPEGMRLQKKGILHRFGEVFLGDQDIKLDDYSFDKQVDVEGESPEEIRDFLTEERRSRIADFLQEAPRLSKITDEKIYVESGGVFT